MMKKILLASLMLLLVIFILTSCGEESVKRRIDRLYSKEVEASSKYSYYMSYANYYRPYTAKGNSYKNLASKYAKKAAKYQRKMEELRFATDTPKNIRINGNVVSWDSVEDAETYYIRVGEEEYSVDAVTSFQIPLTEEASYNVSVAAKGHYKYYNKSGYSSAITYYTKRIAIHYNYNLSKNQTVVTEYIQPNTVISNIHTPVWESSNDNTEKYLFMDWYTDAAYTKPYDENTVVSSELTLYAQWKKFLSNGSKYSGKVTISGVHEVNIYAFKDNTSITEVVLTEGLEAIGSSAFEGCTNLKSITIPKSVKTIEHDAFYGCYNLKSVYISDVGEWAKVDFDSKYSSPFYHGADLYVNNILCRRLIIPEGVTKISNYAFCGIECAREVFLPASLTEIGYDAFEGSANIYVTYFAKNKTNVSIKSGNYNLTAQTVVNNMTVDKITLTNKVNVTLPSIPITVTYKSSYDYVYAISVIRSIEVLKVQIDSDTVKVVLFINAEQTYDSSSYSYNNVDFQYEIYKNGTYVCSEYVLDTSSHQYITQYTVTDEFSIDITSGQSVNITLIFKETV